MPAVLRVGPYRFYFYNHDLAEPPHIHVDRDDRSAKFWLDPVAAPYECFRPWHRRVHVGIIPFSKKKDSLLPRCLPPM